MKPLRNISSFVFVPALMRHVEYCILSVCLCHWGSRCWASCCCVITLLWAIWPPRLSSPSASSAPGKSTHRTGLSPSLQVRAAICYHLSGLVRAQSSFLSGNGHGRWLWRWPWDRFSSHSCHAPMSAVQELVDVQLWYDLKCRQMSSRLFADCLPSCKFWGSLLLHIFS